MCDVFLTGLLWVISGVREASERVGAEDQGDGETEQETQVVLVLALFLF